VAEVDRERAALHLARELLGQERPAELPLFDAQASELLDEIRRGERTRRSTDQFLGIGGDGVLALLTPAIIALSWAAVGFLTDVARSAAKDVLKDRLESGSPGTPRARRRLCRRI
jgi:hypothetical protein